MCEPEVIYDGPGRFAGTCLSVAEHQVYTRASSLELCELWPTYCGEA
jgi:hypothetical protein